MITKVSDTHIRGFARAHLERHGLDPDRLHVRVLNGTVGFTGEARHAGGRLATLEALQKLERDVLATTGVRHVSFGLTNWNRPEFGTWEPLGPDMREVPAPPRYGSLAYGDLVDGKLADRELELAGASARETSTTWVEASNCFVAPITMDELLEARDRGPRS